MTTWSVALEWRQHASTRADLSSDFDMAERDTICCRQSDLDISVAVYVIAEWLTEDIIMTKLS